MKKIEKYLYQDPADGDFHYNSLKKSFVPSSAKYRNNPDYLPNGIMGKVKFYYRFIDIDDYYYARKEPFGKRTFLFEPWPIEFWNKVFPDFNENERGFWREFANVLREYNSESSLRKMFSQFTKQQQNYILNLHNEALISEPVWSGHLAGVAQDVYEIANIARMPISKKKFYIDNPGLRPISKYFRDILR